VSLSLKMPRSAQWANCPHKQRRSWRADTPLPTCNTETSFQTPYRGELTCGLFRGKTILRRQDRGFLIDRGAREIRAMSSLPPQRVATVPPSRDNRAGQFRALWREESIEGRPSEIARESGVFLCEGGRSGFSERVGRPTRPAPEGSVERRRFRVLQEERDVADAEAGVLQQGPREVCSHLVENLAE
jgi:hypothetical protein